jgi:TonB family protein
LILISVLAFSEDRGSCPSAPPASANAKSKTEPAVPDEKDTVTLLVVVSDKGYVCSIQVLRAANKQIGQRVESAVQQWKFKPATKSGKRVPVVMKMLVYYRMNDPGKLIVEPPPGAKPK